MSIESTHCHTIVRCNYMLCALFWLMDNYGQSSFQTYSFWWGSLSWLITDPCSPQCTPVDHLIIVYYWKIKEKNQLCSGRGNIFGSVRVCVCMCVSVCTLYAELLHIRTLNSAHNKDLNNPHSQKILMKTALCQTLALFRRLINCLTLTTKKDCCTQWCASPSPDLDLTWT